MTSWNDCDDTNADIRPNLVWYKDADNDGTGGSNSQEACYQPTGYGSSTGDACDTNSSTSIELTWYFDADGDDFAGSTSATLAYTAPANYYATADDSDDNDEHIHPNNKSL